MNKNIRIAKELLRIAQTLASPNKLEKYYVLNYKELMYEELYSLDLLVECDRSNRYKAGDELNKIIDGIFEYVKKFDSENNVELSKNVELHAKPYYDTHRNIWMSEMRFILTVEGRKNNDESKDMMVKIMKGIKDMLRKSNFKQIENSAYGQIVRGKTI